MLLVVKSSKSHSVDTNLSPFTSKYECIGCNKCEVADKHLKLLRCRSKRRWNIKCDKRPLLKKEITARSGSMKH